MDFLKEIAKKAGNEYAGLVAFIDKGQAIGHKYPFIVPPIEYRDYEYTDPNMKEGMNLGVISDIRNNKTAAE